MLPNAKSVSERHHGPRPTSSESQVGGGSAISLMSIGNSNGFVANFAQEVLKGQLPLSRRGLCGQGVELFGHREALRVNRCGDGAYGAGNLEADEDALIIENSIRNP
jgi:hypothetical protein